MTCQMAAERLSRELDTPRGGRFWLGVHLAVCHDCRRFRRQLLVLDAVSKTAVASDVPPDGDGLSAAARERIAAEFDGGRR